ncbi:MAG: type II secretion system F family protein [Candidatus Nanohaloarchaeota archaeon QJJ-7]|nr:type II secretion system F family protein [Candidatus Nanohaloarchaeota archaeon QJJ-7]
MESFESYVRFSQRSVGQLASRLEPYFRDVSDDLVRADIGLTLNEFLSTAVLTSGITFAVITPMISMIVGLVTGSILGMLSGLIMGLFVGIFLAVAVFMGFYFYPSVRVGQRRSDIDNNLPFATMYLSTIAGTGTPPAALFDLLGDFDEYGEVSEEAEHISRDIYTFGAGTTQALRSAAQRTPSEKFKELMWGINSILTTGGNLEAYLREKSESFMSDYRRSLDEFTDTLSLLVEMYITLVIVGSVFLIIISTIMSSMGESTTLIVSIQIFTALFLLPFSAVMFIVIVKGVSPLE